MAKWWRPMALLAAMAFVACAQRTTITPVENWPDPLSIDDVVVRVEVDKPRVEIGEPVMARLVYRNTGINTYWLSQVRSIGWPFFEVRDDSGNLLDDPFRHPGGIISSGPVSAFIPHRLGPGEEFALPSLLNSCVVFPRPGTYSIYPLKLQLMVGTKQGQGSIANSVDLRLAQTQPFSLRVITPDSHKRKAILAALVDAWHNGGPLPKGFIPDMYLYAMGSDIAAANVLAAMSDESLIPVMLDYAEHSRDLERLDTVYCGFEGLPREKTLAALQEALAHPESHNVRDLIVWYELRKYTSHDNAQQMEQIHDEIVKEYQPKYMALLHADTQYRYPKVAELLWEWKQDPFIKNYLAHAKQAK